MARQRGELVPIGDALADLPGPVQAIRDTSPGPKWKSWLKEVIR